MVIFPQVAMDSARKGISLWASSVLPALLPFFICANFLQNIGVIRYLKSGTFPFLMSVLSGYPMGAKIVGDLRRSSEISVGEAKRLMSFCSTSGGVSHRCSWGQVCWDLVFWEVSSRWLIIWELLSTAWYIAAVLGKECGFAGSMRIEEEKGMQESLTEAMLSAFKSLGIILAYIVLFTFATDMMHLCGVFSLVGCTWLRAIVKGIFEMTVGCGAVAECVGISDALRCILCAGILSWGGLWRGTVHEHACRLRHIAAISVSQQND